MSSKNNPIQQIIIYQRQLAKDRVENNFPIAGPASRIELMGRNYGLDYPGAPFLGPLAMVWFTLRLGNFLGWVTLKGGSVWPAVIGHGAINGIASLGVLFGQGEPNSLLGSLPTGIIGGLGFTLVALINFISPGGLSEPETTSAHGSRQQSETTTGNRMVG